MITKFKLFENSKSPQDIDFFKYIMTNNIKKLQKYIDDGGDINIQDKYGYTGIMIALKWSKYESISFLLKSGIDLNIRNNKGNTALMFYEYFSYSLKNHTYKTIDDDLYNYEWLLFKLIGKYRYDGNLPNWNIKNKKGKDFLELLFDTTDLNGEKLMISTANKVIEMFPKEYEMYLRIKDKLKKQKKFNL